MKALSNYDITKYAKKFKLRNFRGVFMKDELPVKCNLNECGIINLQNSNQIGSHWVAYFKHNFKTFYFDSYGDAKPPIELVKYVGSNNLYYNSDQIQEYNDPPICGHLSLLVLRMLSNGSEYTYNMLRNCKEELTHYF